MKLRKIIDEYVVKNEEYEAKEGEYQALVEKREKQLEWAKKRQSKFGDKYPSWVENLIEPIAKEMVKQMPDRYYKILGPFGLSAETSIHFYKKGIPEKETFENDNCISITFVPRDLSKGELLLRDYSIDTHTYSEGSMGEMNGMNHPDLPIKDGIDGLMGWMKQQNAKKGQKK